jgi:membrane protein implicated in regulation of membrane protease activity
MLGLYLFSAVVGGAFVVFFILFGDADADVGGLAADVDLDAEVDAGTGSGLAAAAADFLSFRSLAFFLGFFGITGIVLRALGAATLVSLPLAVAMGLFALWLNTRLMRYLKRADVDGSLRNRDLTGRPAEVVIAIDPDSKGRIAIDVAGQQIYLVARPFRTGSFAIGDHVVVIEIDNGTALVASMEEL